jgi:hypothetical protein
MRRVGRVLGLVATAGLIAALTAACGDDRPSEQALTERVTEICQASGERHEAAAAGFDWASFDPETSDLTELVLLIEENVAIGRETSNELDKVRGPESEEAKIDRWIQVNGEIAANADQMLEAARDDDRETFMALGGAEEELHARFPEDPMFEGC